MALLTLVVVALAGCGNSGPPPEETLGKFGAQVGTAGHDQLDFPSLLKQYTTPAYQAQAQPEQAQYKLFLAAKAADLALNKKPGDKVIKTETSASGDKATVTFTMVQKDGLFSVADVSKVVATMQKTKDDQTVPWRIDGIELVR
jgi:hypothetical protein